MTPSQAPLIVDGHNDLLMELEYRRQEENPFARHWLGNLQQGGVGLCVCPIYGSDLDALPEHVLRRDLLQVAAFMRAGKENPDEIVLVRTTADLEVVERRERIGLMLSVEGFEALGIETTLLELFHHLGVRMASMTWNRRNVFGDGLAEPANGKLSTLGRELVGRMAELDIILDLAHISEAGFWDALEHTDGPVCVSHAGCRGVTDIPRNLTDDQLRALAERGGVLGMILLPFAIDPEGCSIERAVDHIDHAVSVMGIDHVGFGADFGVQLINVLPVRIPPDAMLPGGLAMDASLDGMSGAEHYGILVDALRRRGYEGERLEKILGGNWLRQIRQVLPG